MVSQGTSRSNAKNCSGVPPPTRQSASIEAELLGLTSIYSELSEYVFRKIEISHVWHIVSSVALKRDSTEFSYSSRKKTMLRTKCVQSKFQY